MDVYYIVSKWGMNISKFLQYRFYECGISITIFSDNAQEEFIRSVHKLIRAYGVEVKQSEAHKQNQNPAERRIHATKVTNCTILNRSGAPSWYWLLCMACVVSIINCMDHLSLSWCNPHKYENGFMTNIAHLTEFELWETILILDERLSSPTHGVYLDTTMDLILIKLLSAAPGYLLRIMAYLYAMSSIILTSLYTPTVR